MATISKTVEELLGEIFDQSCDIEDSQQRAKRRDEFVFHMTDWKSDLHRLAELYNHPATFDRQDAKETVNGILYHALGHLIAAARLYDYVPDPFAEVGQNAPVES